MGGKKNNKVKGKKKNENGSKTFVDNTTQARNQICGLGRAGRFLERKEGGEGGNTPRPRATRQAGWATAEKLAPLLR